MTGQSGKESNCSDWDTFRKEPQWEGSPAENEEDLSADFCWSRYVYRWTNVIPPRNWVYRWTYQNCRGQGCVWLHWEGQTTCGGWHGPRATLGSSPSTIPRFVPLWKSVTPTLLPNWDCTWMFFLQRQTRESLIVCFLSSHSSLRHLSGAENGAGWRLDHWSYGKTMLVDSLKILFLLSAPFNSNVRLSRWPSSSKELACQCRRGEFDPWSGKIPCRRK